MDLNSRVALVTGATRGIGQAIAVELAKQGHFVIGTATSSAGKEAIEAHFLQNSLQGRAVVLDVTQQEAVDELMESLSQVNQTPAILVNNAGITADNLLLRMDDEEWYRVLETNLNAVFRMTRACIKTMFRARFGRVISVGSVVGSMGNSGQVNYTAAKAGLIGFSKSLAQEIGSRGITVNVVSPGFIDTDMTTALPDLVKQEMLKRIPMKRFGNPADVAAVVAFLASDAANYVTGETIHVNGGMYMN